MTPHSGGPPRQVDRATAAAIEPSTRAAFSSEVPMASSANGIGSFMTDNIVSVLRHLPETNGTYAQVIALATEHGPQLSATTLGK